MTLPITLPTQVQQDVTHNFVMMGPPVALKVKRMHLEKLRAIQSICMHSAQETCYRSPGPLPLLASMLFDVPYSSHTVDPIR